MESLKIAFFCWESLYGERVGGLANAATNLATTLAHHHEIHYFTRGTKNDQIINGVHYHYCQPRGFNIIEYCDSMSHQMVEQFNAIDKERSFDLLHFHDWHPVQALHLLQNRNTLLSYHSTEYGRNGNQYGNWWEYKEISGKEWYGGLIAKRITTVSVTLKHEVMELYHIPEWKCEIIPNGVVPRQFRADIDPGEVKRSYGIHPYAPLILFIGRLVYQKGPDILIDAFNKVHQNRWDAHLIIAGDGSMRQYLEDRAKNLPVHFLGYTSDSDYIRILNACDIVVIPSRNEPFGLVLLEAWSAEKGVVASDVGGLSENISGFVDGITVHPDPDSFAWGISALLQEPHNAITYGKQGSRKVKRQFLWEPIGKQMTDLYSLVIG